MTAPAIDSLPTPTRFNVATHLRYVWPLVIVAAASVAFVPKTPLRLLGTVVFGAASGTLALTSTPP